MSQLSEQIRILVDSFPSSFSELARRTGIDRSTLYKIIGGKRLPTHQQFQALLAVCHATQPQQQELFQLYQSATTDSATQEKNIHLLSLLKSLLCGTPPHFEKSPILSDKSIDPEFSMQKNPQQIHAILSQGLSQYFSSPSEMPLMISSHLPACIQNFLLQTADEFSIPHKIWQLTVLSTCNSSQFYQSLSLLADTIPLLYADSIEYRGRLFYEETAPAQHQDILLPHYILLPTQAFLFDIDGSAMYCIHDTAAVEHLRFRFTQEFLRAESYLIQDAADAIPTNILAQVGCIPNPETELCYFSESSLLAFARSTKHSPKARQKLLHTLYQRCADGALVRLIDESLLPIAADSCLYITDERHLLIQRHTSADIHQYKLQDKDISEALLQYLSLLENSPLLHTRQYTMDFIQCCISVIPAQHTTATPPPLFPEGDPEENG